MNRTTNMLSWITDKTSGAFFSPHPIRCIGTYHKTGTVWMLDIFREIAALQGLEFYRIGPDPKPAPVIKSPSFVFAHKSKFPNSLFNKKVRGIRIIRDPRDVVISAAHYHCHSDEPWLHEARDYLKGKTYAQAISELNTDIEKYRFELMHTSARVIAQMVDADGQQDLNNFVEKNFLTIRYEDLVVDGDLQEVKKICNFLRLPFKKVAPIFVKRSLFGEQSAGITHIRSGKPKQWMFRFTPEFAQEFAGAQQHSLEALGYESDKSWLRA